MQASTLLMSKEMFYPFLDVRSVFFFDPFWETRVQKTDFFRNVAPLSARCHLLTRSFERTQAMEHNSVANEVGMVKRILRILEQTLR